MAVDLHTGDTSHPYRFFPDKQDHDVLSQAQDHHHSIIDNNTCSALKPRVLIPHEFGSHRSPLVIHSAEEQGKDKEDDFIAEISRQMAHFTLQDDEQFDFSAIGSQNLESSWDLIGSPQSNLWSPFGSNQGSTEGSYQEPSPGNSQDSCWESTYDVGTMFEKMNLEERGTSKFHSGLGIQSSNTSNVGFSSYQALIQEQIRAIQLSRLKQEQVLSLKRKLTAYRESQGQIPQQSVAEPKEQVLQFQKKGKGSAVSGNGRRTRPPRPAPLQSHPQAGLDMRALFPGGSGSRGASCGTGVFLPRSGTGAPSEPRKRPGKGCSTVRIPARVVQALQLHFDQMAATSGPKAGGFPPLQDVLVSNRDGMYSLLKRQSRKAPANYTQNEMILPPEWTY